jgi:hypothetical protein
LPAVAPAFRITRFIALHQVSPPKTEYQKDRLSYCVEHTRWCGVPIAGFVCVEVMFKETTQHANCTARFLGANKFGARDE